MLRFFSRWFSKKKPVRPRSPDKPAAPARPAAPQAEPASGKAVAEVPGKALAPAEGEESRETGRVRPAPLLQLPARMLRPRRARRPRRRPRRLKPRTPLQRPGGNKRYSPAEVQAIGLAPATLHGRYALDRRRSSRHQHNCEQLQAALATTPARD